MRAYVSAAAQADSQEFLVQDSRAFNARCPGPPSAYSASCANESASLQHRQQDLHVSAADLARFILAADFIAFAQRCPEPSSYSQSCADQLAALKRRQQALHLTDADLEAAGTRNGIRGGIR